MEASFSTYRMWNSIGMASAFYASAHWRWHVKVVGLLLLVAASGVGYVALLLSDHAEEDEEGEGGEVMKSCGSRIAKLLCPAEEGGGGKRRPKLVVEGDDTDTL